MGGDNNINNRVILPNPEGNIVIPSFSGKELIMDIKERTKIVVENTEVIDKSSIIYILQNAIDTFKDDETIGHMTRLGILSKCIGNLMVQDKGFDTLKPHYIEYLGLTAPLHDIGKIGIPLPILKKPGKLTAEEYDIVKNHPEIGWKIIEDIRNMVGRGPILEMAQNISLYHHEKFDGTGYPYGIKGEDIPLSARIVAIVDVLDVLKSRRVYKKDSFPDELVEKIISEGRGTHFDPYITDIVLKNLSEILKLREALRD